MPDESLYSVLSDVVNGYSYCKIDGKDAFIKHLDLKSELKASTTYQRFFNLYKERGCPTKDERLAFLAEEGDWTNKDEAFISTNRKYLANLIKTKDKLIIKAQLVELESQILETSKKLQEKLSQKESLVGATCEKYASQKKEETQILDSVYKDENFTELFLSETAREYCDDSEITFITRAYFDIFKQFSEDVLKKISVSALFYNFFSLSPKDNPSQMFGKPILELTFFQQKLLHFSQNVRYIYENVPDIPDEIKDDYDNLVEFSRKEKITDKGNKGNAGYSVVGATKKEMELAGVDVKNTVSPFEMLRKSGKKSLSREDFLKTTDYV